MIFLGNSQAVGPAIGGVVPGCQQHQFQDLQIGEVILQWLQVGGGDAVRFNRQLAGECERHPTRDRQFGPVAIQPGQVIVRQPIRRQFRLLVAQAVMAVVEPRDDPENLGDERCLQRHPGVGLAIERGRTAQLGGQVEIPHAGVVNQPRAQPLGRGGVGLGPLQFLGGGGRKRQPGLAPLELLEGPLHFGPSRRDRFRPRSRGLCDKCRGQQCEPRQGERDGEKLMRRHEILNGG